MTKLMTLVAFAAMAVCIAVGTAGASPYVVTGPTVASGGPSPFPAGCGGPGEAFHTAAEVAPVNFPDTEVEPWIEVNPQDPLDLEDNYWETGPTDTKNGPVIHKNNHKISGAAGVPASIRNNAGLEAAYKDILTFTPTA